VSDVAGIGISTGSPVVIYLHEPKEKMWGLLVSVAPSGLCLRGMDIRVFDDWMRQESRDDERMIGAATIFFPMHRVERVELDETVGPLTSYEDRFVDYVGRPVAESLGWVVPGGKRGRRRPPGSK
jgi:hypothetical protein